jgi:hypothetical protein
MGTPRTSFHQANTAMTLLAATVETNTHMRSPTNTALFTHTVGHKANSIRFAHQSLCSPKIPTIRQGYLKGCPNLTAAGITKYLNPSPATAKGHTKRLQMGIRSTRCQHNHVPSAALTPTNPAHIEVLSTNSLIPNV